jgi:hypothetical protein
VDTLLIKHAREVELHIASKSWRTVASPGEAFEAVRACIGKTPSPAFSPAKTAPREHK